jgi:hypothetical protein
MEIDHPCRKEQGPISIGFPLGFCDHSTKYSVGCHHISLMEKDPKYELVDCS